MSREQQRSLAARQGEVQARLAQLRGEWSELVGSSADTNQDDEHDPEGATIAFERSQLDALVNIAVDELADIEQAVIRLAAGTYGRCERCSELIGSERLDARPATRLCIRCASSPDAPPGRAR